MDKTNNIVDGPRTKVKHMRLVCPNCDAEYEVDASVIPEAGRDVQCSNCGHAWFQGSLELEAELEAAAELYDPEPVPGQIPPAPPAETANPGTAQPDPTAVPRGLDESVLAVLREEAEREAAARRAETPTVETQAELGLAAAQPADTSARRVARIKGIDPDAAPARSPTGRELLPEIDEINSTLRATSARRSSEPDQMAIPDSVKQAGGFRSGFALMLFVAVIFVALYTMAPRISEQIPGLAPTIAGYVAAIDALRGWLDGVMQMAITGLRGLTGGPA